MKKIFIAALTLFFAASTLGLVMAAPAASTTPTGSTVRNGKNLKSHKGRHHKKDRLTPASAAAAAGSPKK